MVVFAVYAVYLKIRAASLNCSSSADAKEPVINRRFAMDQGIHELEVAAQTLLVRISLCNVIFHCQAFQLAVYYSLR